ncbi:MAG TPA: VIT domain-containing protein, partial [candidate division Zixibacteria bacterium]|nr:VIT domain-containing protein [candidate division Zixibacteria bacterium]
FLGAPEWEFDEDRGSSSVGKRQTGLKLSESAIDGIVRTSENYGYYEWTMVFDNTTRFGKEARAAVQLPAYSVVSKASLWVDGEERQAAFGATARVRSVYRRIVSYRRDPLLVTMIGPDQVQVQCFPVPANGSMKIRIGITCPLLEGQKLPIPHFIETNFDITENLQHKVWVEGDAPTHVALSGELNEDSVAVLSISDEQLSRPDTYLSFDVTQPDAYSLDNGALTLRKIQEDISGVGPVLLIDGREDLLTKLKSVDWSAKKFSEVLVAEPFGYTAWDNKKDLAQFLNDESVYGGVNPCPALLQSMRLATIARAPIVWIHGSLPSAVRDELGLEQIFRRSDHPVKIVTLAASGELNSMISDLTYMRYFSPQASSGDFGRDFAGAIESAERLTKVSDGAVPLGGRTTSGFEFKADSPTAATHPYRLYLYSQIMQSWNAEGSVPDDLITKALKTHLVTPVTGAVVLENAEQFETAGLDPSVGVENVPKIPEPEFYILLSIALLTMAVWFWRKRVAA